MWLSGKYVASGAYILVTLMLQFSLLPAQDYIIDEPYALPLLDSDSSAETNTFLSVTLTSKPELESCPIIYVTMKVGNETLDSQLRTCGTTSEERLALESNLCPMAGIPANKIATFLHDGISAFPRETWDQLPIAFLASIVENASPATQANPIFPELLEYVSQAGTLGAVATSHFLQQTAQTTLTIPASTADALPLPHPADRMSSLLSDPATLKTTLEESAAALTASERREWNQVVCYLTDAPSNPIRDAFPLDNMGDNPVELVQQWLEGHADLQLDPEQGAVLFNSLHPDVDWAGLTAQSFLQLLNSIRPLIPYLSYTQLAAIHTDVVQGQLAITSFVKFAKTYPNSPFATWVAYRLLQAEDYSSLLSLGPALSALSTKDLQTLADNGHLTLTSLEELSTSPYLTPQDLYALKSTIQDLFDSEHTLTVQYLPLTDSSELLNNGTSRPIEEWEQVMQELNPAQSAALARHFPVYNSTLLMQYLPLEHLEVVRGLADSTFCTLHPEIVRYSIPDLKSLLNYYNTCFVDTIPPPTVLFTCRMIMEAPLRDVIDYLKQYTCPLPRSTHHCFMPRLRQWVGVRFNSSEVELLVSMEPNHFQVFRQLLLSFHPLSVEVYLHIKPETCSYFFQALKYANIYNDYNYEELSIHAGQAVTCYRINTASITFEDAIKLQELIFYIPAHAYAALPQEIFRFIYKQRSTSPQDVALTYPACRSSLERDYLYHFMIQSWGPLESWNSSTLQEIGCLAVLLQPDDHYSLSHSIGQVNLRRLLPLWSACLARATAVVKTQFCVSSGNILFHPSTPSTALQEAHPLAPDFGDEELDDVFRQVVQKLARQEAEQVASIEGRHIKFDGLTCDEVTFAGSAAYDKSQWAKLSYNGLMECLKPIFLAQNPDMTSEEAHALWGIIRCRWGVPGNVPAEILTQLGPVALGIPLWHLQYLNLTSWDAVGALGATKGWKAEQVQALAQALLNSQKRRIPTDPYHVELLGALTCGLTLRQLTAILTPDTLKQLGVGFYSQLEACSPDQLKVIADMVKKAFGPPNQWDSLLTEALNFVILGLNREEFATLTPNALHAIHKEVRDRILQEYLQDLPMEKLLWLNLHGMGTTEVYSTAITPSDSTSLRVPVQCINRTISRDVIFTGSDFSFNSPSHMHPNASLILHELEEWNGQLDALTVINLLMEDWAVLPAEFWEDLPGPILEKLLEHHFLDDSVPVSVLEAVLLDCANKTATPRSIINRLWSTVASNNGSSNVLLETRDKLSLRVDSQVVKVMQEIGNSTVLSDLTVVQLQEQPWPKLLGSLKVNKLPTYYSKVIQGGTKKPSPPVESKDLRLYLANWPRESTRYDITPKEWQKIVSSRFPPVTKVIKPITYSKKQIEATPPAQTILELANTPFSILSRLALNESLESVFLIPDLVDHGSEIASLITAEEVEEASMPLTLSFLDSDIPIAPHTICSFAARVAENAAIKVGLPTNWTYSQVLRTMDRFDIMRAREALLGFSLDAFADFVYEFHDTQRCYDLLSFLGTLDVSSANDFQITHLVNIGLHCYVNKTDSKLDDDMLSMLGGLAPYLEADYIRNIPSESVPYFLELHGPTLTPKCADEYKRVILRQLILESFPPVSSWTRATILELGCMVTVLQEEDLSLLDKEAILTWGQILPRCREQLDLHDGFCLLHPEDEKNWDDELERLVAMEVGRLFPDTHAKCKEMHDFAGSSAVLTALADNQTWNYLQLEECAAVLKEQNETVPHSLAVTLWNNVVIPYFQGEVSVIPISTLGSIVTGASADQLRSLIQTDTVTSRKIAETILSEWNTYDWTRDQARVLLDHLLAQERPISDLLSNAGTLICALTNKDITRMEITQNVWSNVVFEVFDKTKTCGAKAKKFLLDQVLQRKTWTHVTVQDIAYYRYLWTAVRPDQWDLIPPTSMAGLSADVIEAMPLETLELWTDERIKHLGDLEKKAYYKKLGILYDLQPCLSKPTWILAETIFSTTRTTELSVPTQAIDYDHEVVSLPDESSHSNETSEQEVSLGRASSSAVPQPESDVPSSSGPVVEPEVQATQATDSEDNYDESLSQESATTDESKTQPDEVSTSSETSPKDAKLTSSSSSGIPELESDVSSEVSQEAGLPSASSSALPQPDSRVLSSSGPGIEPEFPATQATDSEDYYDETLSQESGTTDENDESKTQPEKVSTSSDTPQKDPKLTTSSSSAIPELESDVLPTASPDVTPELPATQAIDFEYVFESLPDGSTVSSEVSQEAGLPSASSSALPQPDSKVLSSSGPGVEPTFSTTQATASEAYYDESLSQESATPEKISVKPGFTTVGPGSVSEHSTRDESDSGDEVTEYDNNFNVVPEEDITEPLSQDTGINTLNPSAAPSASESTLPTVEKYGVLPVTKPSCEWTALAPAVNEVTISYRDPNSNKTMTIKALEPVLYYEGGWCNVSCPSAAQIPQEEWDCTPHSTDFKCT